MKRKFIFFSTLILASMVYTVFYSINEEYLKSTMHRLSDTWLYKTDKTKDKLTIINKNSARKVICVNNVRFGYGYGNNMYKILTAFLVAILTDSNLILEWPAVEEFIEEPFENTFYHGNVSNRRNFTKSENVLIMYGRSINTWKPGKKLFLNISIPNNYKTYYMAMITAYFFDLCSNPKHFDKLIKHRLVKEETIQRALNSLEDENIVEQQRIEYFLLIGFEYAGTILNKYWRLSKRMQEKVDDYYKKNFEGAYVIGMQFRFEFMNESDVQAFLNCANEFEGSLIEHIPVKWYISSDTPTFVEKMKEEYNDKVLTGNGIVGHISRNFKSYERVIFDLEMLSRCDVLIFTGGSTFGFLPALKNQRRPYYVVGNVGMKKCQKMTFYNPAYSHWKVSVF